MKYWGMIFIFWGLISSIAVLAQQRIVTGQVIDAETREPLPFASIQLSNSTTGTTTLENGNFSIEALNTGSLIVSYVGYVADTITLRGNQTRYTIALRPDARALPEVIVVSGTLKEVTKSNSSIPVEIYSPALFRKNPTPSIFESLTMVNGVQPQLNCNVCNTGDIHINGMEGPYTMVLIDGMPIVSSLSTAYGLSGIPNSMVKRIEIAKGPASTLYGSEAVGGLINIITKDPSLSPQLHVDLSATSLAEFNGDVTSSWKAGQTSALLGLNYFAYNRKMDINNDNFTDVSLQNRVSLFNKWEFTRAENRQANVAFRYVYEDRWGGELQWRKEFRGSDSVYGESIYTSRAEVIGNYQLPVRHQNVMIDYSYNYHLQDSYYGTTQYLADQHVGFIQMRWNKKIATHDLLMGIPFRAIYYNDNSVATEQAQYTYLPGVFIQDEWQASKHLTLLTGLRYDHHNKHGSIFSPRASVKFSPSADHTFRLSSGNGFRVVNLFTEDHAALTGAREVVIKNELKPEQSWNVNFNYTNTLRHTTGYATVDASAFYTYFTNKIVGDFLTDPQQIIYDNLQGHAISQGFTLNMEASFVNGLKAMAGITWMDVYQTSEDEFGNSVKTQQLFAPEFSGTYSLSYAFAKNSWVIDLTGRFNGPMHLPTVPNDFRPSQSPWYTLMNIQVTKTFSNGFEVYGGAKNILNFIPENPLFNWQAPFSEEFDASYNYAPVQGIKAFLGIRYTLP
jgi:outer membrane receptor for ferrienterochelin and colicins